MTDTTTGVSPACVVVEGRSADEKATAACILEAVELKTDRDRNPVVTTREVYEHVQHARETGVCAHGESQITVADALDVLEADDYVRRLDITLERGRGPVTIWFDADPAAFHRDYVTDHDAEWPSAWHDWPADAEQDAEVDR